ncbi:MAG: hypothetical protein AAF465_10500 [Pseudomonadota bacterium]
MKYEIIGTFRRIGVIAFSMGSAILATAQTPSYNESWLTIDNPHVDLFSEVKISGSDYLDSTLDVANKGASITWAPFLFKDISPIFSQTKFRLSQKDSVSSLGVAVQYNPFNTATARNRIRKSMTNQFDSTNADRLAAVLEKRKTDLNEEVKHLLKNGQALDCDQASLNNRDYESATLELIDYADRKPAGGAGRAAQPIRPPSSSEAVNLSHAVTVVECAINLDIKFTDLSFPDLTNTDKFTLTGLTSNAYLVLEQHYIIANRHSTEPTELESLRTLISSIEKRIASIDSSTGTRLYTVFVEELLNTKLPIVTLSYSGSFFPVIGEGNFDANNNNLNDNEHTLKSRNVSLAFDWRLSEKNQISLIYNHSDEKATAEEGQRAAQYNGFGITWATKIRKLSLDGPQQKKEFLESFFDPSINFGIAYEQKDCNSEPSICIDRIERTQAITPFIDFKLGKTKQFRIGVPYKRNKVSMLNEEIEEDEFEFRATFAFQLGLPK